jgi:hypothetical protein
MGDISGKKEKRVFKGNGRASGKADRTIIDRQTGM